MNELTDVCEDEAGFEFPGVTPVPVEVPPELPLATHYLFSGPVSGQIDLPSTFTVALPAGTATDEPIIITPDDGGAGGTFIPTIVELSTEMPVAYFAYVPMSYGIKIISVNDDGDLADPAMLNFVVTAGAYTLTGPVAGETGDTSTAFTVALPVGAVVTSTVTITPDDDGASGIFTPSTVALTTASPSATFVYTPTTSFGNRSIGVTNNRELTNPANLTYTVITRFEPEDVRGIWVWFKADTLTLSDGDDVTLWTDSSPIGSHYTVPGHHTATPDLSIVPTGTPPKFRANVINGKPVLRFDGVGSFLYTSYIWLTYPNMIFLVGKQSSKTTRGNFIQGHGDSPQTLACLAGTGYYQIGGPLPDPTYNDSIDHSGAFHVFRFECTGPDAKGCVDGVTTVSGSVGLYGAYLQLYGVGEALDFLTGDIAEILYYNCAPYPDAWGYLKPSDIKLIENYYFRRYALPPAVPVVPGPDHVAGLVFWLKTDALVQADGTEIATWADSSGNGHSFVKGTTGPTFKTNIINEKPVARFNGNATQNVQFIPTSFPQPITVIFVAKVTNGHVWQTQIYPNNWVGVSFTSFSMFSDPSDVLNTDSQLNDNINHTSAFHVFVAEFYGVGVGGGGSRGYVDGVETMFGDAGESGIGRIDLSKALYIGAGMTGDIAEVIFYDRILETDKRQEIELYLKTKYDTP